MTKKEAKAETGVFYPLESSNAAALWFPPEEETWPSISP